MVMRRRRSVDCLIGKHLDTFIDRKRL